MTHPIGLNMKAAIAVLKHTYTPGCLAPTRDVISTRVAGTHLLCGPVSELITKPLQHGTFKHACNADARGWMSLSDTLRCDTFGCSNR